MHMIAGVLQYVAVASFAEAWIEIQNLRTVSRVTLVASFAEAWIEILYVDAKIQVTAGRLLRGGVD